MLEDVRNWWVAPSHGWKTKVLHSLKTNIYPKAKTRGFNGNLRISRDLFSGVYVSLRDGISLTKRCNLWLPFPETSTSRLPLKNRYLENDEHCNFWGGPVQPNQPKSFSKIKIKKQKTKGYPLVNQHSNGKPPFSIGDTSSNGGFPIAMLVYRSVLTQNNHVPRFLPDFCWILFFQFSH